MKRYGIILLIIFITLTGCMKHSEETETDDEQVSVVKANQGDYSILTPFQSSNLRQEYAIEFREIDMMEIGRQLLNNTKEHFNPNDYYISEGSIITKERYRELLAFESSENPTGLNISSDEGITLSDKTVLVNPRFVSDIVEIDYYKNANFETLDGIAVALVLKRVQSIEGGTYRLSDEDLYTIGSTIGLRFQSYLRSLDGLVDTPIYIGLYVQESDMDSLPDKYLPGYYIGHSFSTGSSTEFVKDSDRWYFLSSEEISTNYPQTASAYTLFKNNVMTFISDQNTSIVGKAFIDDGNPSQIQLQVTTGSRTYGELYAITQYISKQLNGFDGYEVVVNVRINDTTRFLIKKAADGSIDITEIV